MIEPSPLITDIILIIDRTINPKAVVIPEADITVPNIALTLVFLYLIFLIELNNDQTQTTRHTNKPAQRMKKHCQGIPRVKPIVNAAERTYSMIMARNGISVIDN